MDVATAKRIAELYHDIKLYTQKLEELLTYGEGELKRIRICMYEVPEDAKKMLLERMIAEARAELDERKKELDAIKIEREGK